MSNNVSITNNVSDHYSIYTSIVLAIQSNNISSDESKAIAMIYQFIQELIGVITNYVHYIMIM